MVILYSGGLDSAVALAWALSSSHALPAPYVALSFRYGQRNECEVELAAESISAISDKFEKPVTHRVVNLRSVRDVSRSDMLTRKGKLDYSGLGLPTSFVPGRNIIFLANAFAFAASHGHAHVVMGSCRDDRGIPDSNPKFLALMAAACQAGVEEPCALVTPLLDMKKTEIFGLAVKLGIVDIAVDLTLSCHEGSRRKNHWGMGCGKCGVCTQRAHAFRNFR